MLYDRRRQQYIINSVNESPAALCIRLKNKYRLFTRYKLGRLIDLPYIYIHYRNETTTQVLHRRTIRKRNFDEIVA